MRVVGTDSETFAFSAGQAAPKGVCWTFYDGQEKRIQLYRDGLATLKQHLLDPEVILVAHNGPYDFAIACVEDSSLIPLIFKGYETGKIRDTVTRAQLIDIAEGNFYKSWYDVIGTPHKITYSLADLVQRHLGRYMPKTDTWRLRYGELFDVPLDQWPESAKSYALDDAIGAWDLFMHQCESYSLDEGEAWPGCFPDEIPQAKAMFALQLMKIWGIRTDEKAVYSLRDRLVREATELVVRLKKTGLVREDGTKNKAVLTERVEAGLRAAGFTEKDFPLTPGGKLKTDAKTIELAEADEALDLLGQYNKIQKILSTYVPALVQGTRVPINADWRVLVETGRTSCGEPNLQNQPRGGDVRACFVPRCGWVFVTCDIDTAELRSLAEVCLALLGKSEMAEALKRGEDLHLAFAAELLGLTYEETKRRYDVGDKEVEETRQHAKIANFGYPGGLSAKTFVSYARGFGIKLTLKRSEELRDAWFRRWPEMDAYFKFVNKVVGRRGSGRAIQIMSGRVRGEVGFTNCANGYFQGHTADGAKDALWEVTKECYLDRTSPLYGCRPVLFIHDEIIIEAPEGRASSAAMRLQDCIRETVQRWCPNVPVKCSSAMMRRWLKGCKAVFADGCMVPAKPEKRDGKTVWVHDVT